MLRYISYPLIPADKAKPGNPNLLDTVFNIVGLIPNLIILETAGDVNFVACCVNGPAKAAPK